MNEHSEPYANEADSIVEQLLESPEEVGQEIKEDIRVREGLYIGDVREEARQFRANYELFRGVGESFPALRMDEGEDVPVLLGNYFSFPEAPWSREFIRGSPFIYDRLYSFLKSWPRGERQVVIALDKAFSFVRGGMVDFLATRVASVAEFFEANRGLRFGSVPLTLSSGLLRRATVKTVGFHVTVHSSAGLRIHVSPSFQINWRYFGAPSTPTNGTLPGAIYRFAADGGPYAAITPDAGKFDIPYGTVTPVLQV